MTLFLIACALLGMVTGVLAGLLGIGGGLVVVPALIALFHWQGMDAASITHVAIGSSLATIIPTALASIRAHHQRGAVDWPVVKRMALWLLVGACAGGWLAHQIDTGLLRQIFGIFLVVVATQMLLLKVSVQGDERMPGIGTSAFAGTLIGAISGLVGVGGGTMTVPLLAYHGKPLRKAVATSSACGLPIAIGGTLGFALFSPAVLPGGLSSGAVYWPAVLPVGSFSILLAPWGAHWAHRLPVQMLKRLFALFLVLVASRLLGFWGSL